jgi:amino acid transporter
MSSQETQTRSPSSDLGLLDATMVGMGAMIGAGIFALTGLAAETAGPAAILVFALNGVVTSFTALSYAELASAIPKSGGGYAFVEEVFNDFVSFLMGWMLWFAYMIAGALYALAFAPNFTKFVRIYVSIPQATSVAVFGVKWQVIYASIAVLLFVVLNALSTEASGGAETIVTLIKIVVLVIFAAFGITAAQASEFDPLFTEGVAKILPAMGLTFIAFEGYDLITTVTEEVENPRKNIPRAIFISMIATIIIYLVVVYVAIGNLGAAELGRAGETGIEEAAHAFMPENIPVLKNGAAVIAFGAVFSTISALNAVILASSRIVFAMGRNRHMPQRLGQLHHRFGTPYTAVLASAAVMFVSVAFVPVRQVGNLSSLFFLLSFVVVNGAVIKLRRERPNLNRPYEMPFYPAPPILGIVLNLLLGFFIDPSTWLMGLGWLSLGALAYAAFEYGGVVLRWGREPAPDVGPPADGEGEGAAETEDDLSRPTIDPDREGTTERNPDDTGDGIQGPGRGREDQ